MMSGKVLKDGTVLTFDEATCSIKVLRKASVLIIDDRITGIEEDFYDLPFPTDAEIVNVEGKIISPGFVNTHIHLWQTVYRSVAPDVTLVHYFDWLSQMSKTSTTAFTPDDIYISSLEGYLEGLNGGVTSYVEHAHNNWGSGIMKSGFDAAVDSGARVWWCYDLTTREAFPETEQWEILASIAQKPRPSAVSLGLSYNGLAGASGNAFRYVEERVETLKIKAITLHHLGGPWPAMNSSPSSLHEQGLQTLGVPIILSHAPYLTEEDMYCMRASNMHVSITPESEFHYGHGQCTGHLISDQASLGIDTNSTFSGDILTQARLWLQKVRDTNFQKLLNETGLLPATTPMTVEQGFLLATRQGGRSLWRDDIGVIKVGAKADIVIFNGDSPNMLGWSNPVAALMLHANVGDIEHVLVDGIFRKRDFKLVNTKHDWIDVKKRFLEAAKRIQSQAFPPPTIPEKLWEHFPTGETEVVTTIR